MAEADTNESTGASTTTQPAPARTNTTATPPGAVTAPVKVLATDGDGTPATVGTQAEAEQSNDAPKFYVDGQAVSEETYLKAAGENGYDLSRMPANYRPAINTKETK